MLLFPAPELPTIAKLEPFSSSKFIFLSEYSSELEYLRETLSNFIFPSEFLIVLEPSSFSGVSSICLKISSAAAIPFWNITLVEDNCLIGFASIPALPKKAINVPDDIDVITEGSKANHVIKAKARDIIN